VTIALSRRSQLTRRAAYPQCFSSGNRKKALCATSHHQENDGAHHQLASLAAHKRFKEKGNRRKAYLNRVSRELANTFGLNCPLYMEGTFLFNFNRE
jgi:hypothetical protein